MRPFRILLAVGAATLALSSALPSAAQTTAAPTARDRLILWLNSLVHDHSIRRAETLAALSTEEEARQRQVRVRALLAEMIEFETFAGPVVSQTTGTVREDGYDIEKVWYESLPGYRVTGDVYVPGRGGPHPAIIIQPGHGPDGKIGNHAFAVALARAGFVVLSIDIVSEGERLQHYDPDIGGSKVGRPTGEHSMAFGQALPVGGHVSRFFIQDAMRGVDYLMARPDVDDQRIGAFGCSGGGTMTAYLAALDPRIKAAATACYITDFDHQFAPGETGPQDAEQSIPFFIERGLGLADWVEAAAPRPYAVISTTEDMFPIAGARAAFAEARRFYGLFGAADRITMIEGPGGHGNIRPLAPQIVGFFTRWLRDDPTERPVAVAPTGDPARLLVTNTGQLSTSIGSETIQSLVEAEAATLRPDVPAGESASARLQRLRTAVRDIARTTVRPGASAAARPGAGVERDGLSRTPVTIEVEPGITVSADLVQTSGRGRRPAVVIASATPQASQADAWARAGWAVLVVEPRGAGGTEEAKSPLTGDWTLLSLRALMVGKTPVGMRTDDIVAAINWLASREDVDASGVALQASGALGPVALHAAVLDDRIGRVWIDSSLLSYREFVERPISRNMAEVNLPGVLRRYDLPDLAAVLGDRLTVINPVNSVGEPLSAAHTSELLPAAVAVFRGGRDPVEPPPASRRAGARS